MAQLVGQLVVGCQGPVLRRRLVALGRLCRCAREVIFVFKMVGASACGGHGLRAQVTSIAPSPCTSSKHLGSRSPGTEYLSGRFGEWRLGVRVRFEHRVCLANATSPPLPQPIEKRKSKPPPYRRQTTALPHQTTTLPHQTTTLPTPNHHPTTPTDARTRP